MKKSAAYRFLCVTLLLTLIFSFACFSQSNYCNLVDTLFAPLNKSKIETGFLYDRAFPLSGLLTFNKRVNTAEPKRFYQAYSELYTAIYNKSVAKTPDQFRAYVQKYLSAGYVPLGIININYNTVKPDAVTQNLLFHNTTTGRFEDRPGDPYDSNKIIMACPVFDRINYKKVNFVYDPQLFVLQNDYPSAIDSFLIDYGNGEQDTIPRPGKTIDQKDTLPVTFTTRSGTYSFTFIFKLKNNKYIATKASFTDYAYHEKFNGSGYTFNDACAGPSQNCKVKTDTFQSRFTYQGPTESIPCAGVLDYQIYFARGDSIFDKPFLWPGDLYLPEINAFNDTTYHSKDLFDSLHCRGYDIVFFSDKTYQNGVQSDENCQSFSRVPIAGCMPRSLYRRLGICHRGRFF